MKIVMLVISGLLIFTTVVCGLYLKYSGKEVTSSDLNFHMVSGLLMVVAVIITFFVLAKR